MGVPNVACYLYSIFCVVRFVNAGKPHAPRNCTLWNQTSDSVEVSCVAGFDGGLPQRFLLEVYSDSAVPRYVTHFISTTVQN